MRAIFSDDVVKVLGLKGIVEFDDVRVVEVSMNFDLVLNEGEISRGYFFDIDYFYGIFLIKFMDTCSFVYFTRISFS
jgi:hypothetical protein